MQNGYERTRCVHLIDSENMQANSLARGKVLIRRGRIASAALTVNSAGNNYEKPTIKIGFVEGNGVRSGMVNEGVFC